MDARGSMGDIPNTFEPLDDKVEVKHDRTLYRIIALAVLYVFVKILSELKYYYQFWFLPLMSILNPWAQVAVTFIILAFVVSITRRIYWWWWDLLTG